ncbi:MAG TPA: ATP-binding cassette domain-containing protein, partial [Dermatophilaceae bacterium]|nr:ATP-binding cassette domain-containing protein [Dermatophilaceae bacterium]
MPPTRTPADTPPPADVARVRDLAVTVGHKPLLIDVDLTVRRGERVGLIGESGSGKSLTALAIMGLLPEDLAPTGSVVVTGQGPGGVARTTSVLEAGEHGLAAMRGRDVAMVFQEPMTALNPTMRVGAQVA